MTAHNIARRRGSQCPAITYLHKVRSHINKKHSYNITVWPNVFCGLDWASYEILHVHAQINPISVNFIKERSSHLLSHCQMAFGPFLSGGAYYIKCLFLMAYVILNFVVIFHSSNLNKVMFVC